MATVKKATKAQLAAMMAVTLAEVVNATTASETGFLYTLPEVHEGWVAEGLVEINPELTDEYGQIATRATAQGIDFINSNAADEEDEEDESEDLGGIEIEDGISVPARSLRTAAPEAYPFSKLEAEQSFFLAGADLKDVQKHVMRANKKYSEVIPGEYRQTPKGRKVAKTKAIRKFIARAVKKDGKDGVRVWRTA